MSKILLVEDDPSLHSALKDKLTSSGYTVFSARDGVEGLDILEKESIELILVDILMPRMDGIEMIYHWHQNHTTTIPIITITNMIGSATPLHMDPVIIKSNTTLDEIIAEVDKALHVS